MERTRGNFLRDRESWSRKVVAMVVVMVVVKVMIVMVARSGTPAKLQFVKPEYRKRLNRDKRQPFLGANPPKSV